MSTQDVNVEKWKGGGKGGEGRHGVGCLINIPKGQGSESSVQFSSVAQSCPTLCDPMNCSTPGLPVHHQLPEFTQTHVHRVSDAIQPSHPLTSPSPPASNPSQHQRLFQWVNSSHEVAKVLELALASVLPKKAQGWSPSEWTGWISLQSKGLSRSFSLVLKRCITADSPRTVNYCLNIIHFRTSSCLKLKTVSNMPTFWHSCT